jgi:asparagine synthase (glutamine-hydrolysing)
MILAYKFLEKVDRSTMAFGLESRVPFLDNDLAQWAMSLPYHLKRNKTGGKWILRKIMSGKLDKEIVHGRKKGFGTPTNTWMASIVFEMFNDLLSSVDIKNSGMFQMERIRSYLVKHKAGDHSKGIWLWQLFQFMLWWKNYHKYIR